MAYKFLAGGAVSPFTGFRWPVAGEWVSAQVDREARWVFACRKADLPYWLEQELWLVELDAPVREARYQVSAPRARLASRIDGWNAALRREYAAACALRARDLALRVLSPELADRVAGVDDPAEIAAVVRDAPKSSTIASYLADAAACAAQDAAATSYIACVLSASLEEGGGAAFEAERAWQARWLSERLGLDDR